MFTTTRPPSMTLTLRVLSTLLGYPDARLREALPELRGALRTECALAPDRLEGILALIASLEVADALLVESDYVELFDRGRATSLHLFEHVHGDSRERGPVMVDLGETYARAGLLLDDGELPDYLPAVLEFVASQPPREAKAFLGEMSHIFNAILGALKERDSAYAGVLLGLLELAGETTQATEPAAEVPLDEAWAEPIVFDGCSTQGRAKPGQPQPIRVVRKAARNESQPGAST